ncbi:MAG TPA: ABC transporter ATP-binding protein [Ktedonobacterales bacterium]|nr:ABC transporter ATP-binding protein [Ktedonobacterales bacterium]
MPPTVPPDASASSIQPIQPIQPVQPGAAPQPYGAVPFPPPDAAVAAWGLTRAFGPKVAVNGLNLAVRRGEFFGFLGPNGAGKSTTIKMMVGLLRPSFGTAFIDGVDVWRDPLAAKKLIGILPEQLNLYERLTGREIIEFAGRLYDLPKDEVRHRTESLLNVLMLTDDADKLVVDYSVGMRKKAALAAALIHRPRVLFLDEPFEGIDPVSSRVIRDILRDLTTSGTTIFFSSHIMEVVERLCTRVGIINAGQLVAEGTLADLRQRAGSGTENSSLEDIFLQLVGADTREGGLEWLE